MLNHLMIDLETLGTVPGSVIMSIGACFFDPNEDYLNGTIPDKLPLFYTNIDVHSSINAGGKVDGSTLYWWFEQEKAAVNALMNPKPTNFATAINDFNKWVWSNRTKRAGRWDSLYTWAHGDDFDLPMLACAYDLLDKRVPWNFWHTRDTRTLFDTVYGQTGAPVVEVGTKHNAVDDAFRQAIQVQHAYKRLAEQRKE